MNSNEVIKKDSTHQEQNSSTQENGNQNSNSCSNLEQVKQPQVQTGGTSVEKHTKDIFKNYRSVSSADDIKVHPAANLMPMMTGEEKDVLVEDIRANGQKLPVVLFNGEILDGRNRFDACRKLNIQVKVCELDTANTDPYEYVRIRNVSRRNLSQSQLAAVAVNFMEYMKTETDDDVSREKAAAKFGISPRAVQDAKKIKREKPELFDAVFNGKLRINAAMSKIRAENKTAVMSPNDVIGEVLTFIPDTMLPQLRELNNKELPKAARKLVEEKIKAIELRPLTALVSSIGVPTPADKAS